MRAILRHRGWQEVDGDALGWELKTRVSDGGADALA